MALSKTPKEYQQRQLVEALDFNAGNIPRLDADGKKTYRMQVLPAYDRMLRLLMIDAHAAHKVQKNKKLQRDHAPEREEAAEAT